MGFIEKRNGRYRARHRDPLDRQRCETFTRKADAERFLREMVVDIERGRWIGPAGAEQALAQWAEEFMLLSRRLSPSTQDTYRRDLTRYVLRRFGSYRLGRLPADEIENWLNHEVASGSPRPQCTGTTGRCAACSRSRSRRRRSRRTRATASSRRASRRAVFLTWDEAVGLAESIHERYRALIYLDVDSGIRWRELVGLRRAKVDLRRRKVRVTEQLIRLESKEWLRNEPKTAAGVRSISISSETAAIVTEHLDWFAAPGRDSLVFPNKAGHPLISSSFWQHYFRHALVSAGFACRFHDPRHTSVALAIAEGAHPKAIQTRMGHSSINVTLDRYGHLFPELDEAIAVGFGERLMEARSRQGERVVVHGSCR